MVLDKDVSLIHELCLSKHVEAVTLYLLKESRKIDLVYTSSIGSSFSFSGMAVAKQSEDVTSTTCTKDIFFADLIEKTCRSIYM